MFNLLLQSPIAFFSFVIALLIAISFHEMAHAFAAYKLGDDTAKSLGRLTLNPLAHLDLLGTLMLFFVGFGWGKPVPINHGGLKNPQRDEAVIALAGPFSNLLIAIVLAGIFHLTRSVLSSELTFLLQAVAYLNLLLMLFNLIPIPPLDGSRLLALIAPPSTLYWLEKYGLILILIIVFIPIGGGSIVEILISHPLDKIMSLLFPARLL